MKGFKKESVFYCSVLVILLLTIFIILYNSNSIIKFVRENFEDHEQECINYRELSVGLRINYFRKNILIKYWLG